MTESDYALALRAHQEFADVELAGALLQRGGRTYLNLAGSFNVLPDRGTLDER